MAIQLLFYRLGLLFYQIGIGMASLLLPKAKKWISGRRQQQVPQLQGSIWVHCASYGEFEQGRPVIEALHEKYPETPLVISFFSPSGYEQVKPRFPQYEVLYLPLDSPAAARKFIAAIKPKVALFIKYEFWYYYLKTLHDQQIPTYLVSGIFRKDSIFFKPYGGLHRRMLRLFDHLFVQDDDSRQLLAKRGIDHVTVSGDTRFDRVTSIAQQANGLPEVEAFVGSQFCLVCGSTWPVDHKHLARLILQAHDAVFIIAPHEVNEASIRQVEAKIQEATIRLSELGKETKYSRVLIVDSIGQLSKLYRYASMAYIGGGFGAGLHNTLEAAVYGKPLAFGTNFQKFKEARELILARAATPVNSYEKFLGWFQAMRQNDEAVQKAGAAAARYVAEHTGATETVISNIKIK